MADAEGTRAAWARALAAALEHDSWGQVEEAAEAYTRLHVAAAAEHEDDELSLPPPRRAALGAVARVLQLRLQELQGGAEASEQRVGLPGVRALVPVMARLLVSDVQLPALLAGALSAGYSGGGSVAAPTAASGLGGWPRAAGSREDGADAASSPERAAAGGSLSGAWGGARGGGAGSLLGSRSRLPLGGAGAAGAKQRATISAPGGGDAWGRGPGAEGGTLRARPEGVAPGDVTIAVAIESWGAKGAAALADPSVVVSVRDGAGRLLEAVQETPPLAARDGGDALRFGAAVHLQTPLSALGQQWGIFFELRHWKAAKRKRSTKAWCMLESDEVLPLAAGAAGVQPPPRPQGGAPAVGGGALYRKALEVYAKPPLFVRAGARPRLLSSKALYLQVALHVHTH